MGIGDIIIHTLIFIIIIKNDSGVRRRWEVHNREKGADAKRAAVQLQCLPGSALQHIAEAQSSKGNFFNVNQIVKKMWKNAQQYLAVHCSKM